MNDGREKCTTVRAFEGKRTRAKELLSMTKMKLIVVGLAAICLLAVPLALGQGENLPASARESGAGSRNGMTAIEQTGNGNEAEQHAVEKLDDELFAADLNGDAAFFEKNLAADYVRIDAHGEMRNKAETVERYKSGFRKLDALNLKKREVRMFGNTAIVTREDNARGRMGSTEFSGTYRKTLVYMRGKNGQWLNINFQSTKEQPRQVNPSGHRTATGAESTNALR
jgi:ketosteroid isomerase-like protein